MTAHALVCGRCKLPLAKAAAVDTRRGPYCKHCAVTLPPHVRRAAKPLPKAKRSRS